MSSRRAPLLHLPRDAASLGRDATVSDIVGALAATGLGRRLLTEPAQLAAFGSDALTAFRQRPLAVVLVESADEVIETVRLCHRAGVPFVARGSGTSLSGGSLPVEGGIVIALNRLNRILRARSRRSASRWSSRASSTSTSAAAAAPYGLYYAPDPSSQSVCTIGGNVAFNSGGAHCLKYGMTSNHVLGIKVVLPDGEVVDARRRQPGDGRPGPGRAVRRLRGAVRHRRSRSRCGCCPSRRCSARCWRPTTAWRRPGDAVAAGRRPPGCCPVAMEIMDALAIEAAEAAVHAGYPAGARRC